MFGEQRPRFDGWLKESFEAITTMAKRQSLVLVLAGDPDCGKSFIQEFIITPTLGGRRIDPFKVASGQTRFNGELNEAEHLMIQDAAAKKDMASRQLLGDYIKQIAANNSTHHEDKGRKGLTLEPIRRMSTRSGISTKQVISNRRVFCQLTRSGSHLTGDLAQLKVTSLNRWIRSPA
jgi:hypothetical protein